jgi:hypothetical protein
MREPKGRTLSLTEPRRFIGDLVHFAHKVPSAPVSRMFNVSALLEARSEHPDRPSWACLFMKAYAMVGAHHGPLRRAYLEFPWPRLYEHPWMNCALAIERLYEGEEGIFVGIFRAPEQQSIVQLQQALSWYKNETLEKIGFYRQALRFGRVPTPVRRMFWWGTLNISGYKRCKRFGTFGLSTYGNLGAENMHPISPLTTTLTYGPIDPATGRVVVKLIYDHRVLDGAYIARRLVDIEETLNGPIRDELSCGREVAREASEGPPSNVEPLLKPHLPSLVTDRGPGEPNASRRSQASP